MKKLEVENCIVKLRSVKAIMDAVDAPSAANVIQNKLRHYSTSQKTYWTRNSLLCRKPSIRTNNKMTRGTA